MKRRGFTLIELMVVIAIIIILAAIAIPNYLTMTARAKKSRIASDMATLATGLETFKTDWGTYPVKATYEAVDGMGTTQVLFQELAGSGYATATPGTATTPAVATLNKPGATNAVSEKNPTPWVIVTGQCIEYIKAGTMKSITDPFKKAGGSAAAWNDGHIYYKSDATGTTWTLGAWTDTPTLQFIYRTDSMSTISATANLP